MDEETGTAQSGGAVEPSPHEQPQGAPGGIDIQQLADKVYRLAMADARLARARGERVGRRGER